MVTMVQLMSLPSQQLDTHFACIVMVDLVGSTRLAHELPLSHYCGLMSELVQLIILSFEAWGGTVLQHQGDAVLAYWPSGQAPQAVRATLEIPERVLRLTLARQLGLQLQVRSGIALGEVVMGLVGTQQTVYGLPLNLARRLCDAAQPDELLVCERVQAACASRLAPLNFELCLDFPQFQGFDRSRLAFSASRRKNFTVKVDQKGRLKAI